MNGRYLTRALPGKFRVAAWTPFWDGEKVITVVPGKSAVINLHCKVDEKRAIRGRLVLANGLDTEVAGAELRAGAVDGFYKDKQVLTVRQDGTFEIVRRLRPA